MARETGSADGRECGCRRRWPNVAGHVAGDSVVTNGDDRAVV
jgi:hypothetical protein